MEDNIISEITFTGNNQPTYKLADSDARTDIEELYDLVYAAL